ncbi:PR domain zinc finger protein 8 isoform X2 [Dunckerocampus dactyliophorus]|nr:PR domain zinc finger protein 8 isoform X2 [Dunckerocampus dactyliophorus]XP_054654768.1 PR domain zinc finger protein 8 isoform X2 [Dunckerocampus dactyliophorus]
MDYAFLPRSMWTVDSRIVQHPAELHTSVVVTRSIPAGTCFGPCILQHTFYDTIAFIAQKSSDRKAKSCVFSVDPEAMRNSALVLSWLRLVQAARNKEEQNTEAFLKGGQLYVRTTRDVEQEEELLVWYDQELCHLLGFTDMSRGTSKEFRCARCEQVFKNEYPFLAHCRFLCAQIKSDTWSVYEQKHVELKRPHRVTDFHNIARDLEHKQPGSSGDADVLALKRKYQDSLPLKLQKTVLLEKINISNDDNITQLGRSQDEAGGGASDTDIKIKADVTKLDDLGCKNVTFGEAMEAKWTFTHGRLVDSETGESSGLRSSSSSAFSLVQSNNREQKSAFCKPSKRIAAGGLHHGGVTTGPSIGVEEMSEVFASRTVSGYNTLMAPSILSNDMHTLSSPFHYTPEHWSRTSQVQSTSALTVLPPTFTSFGVSVQNWCAKCNLSFRMTSDLVFHMRSHHKKEFAAESQVRRRREEKLTCPICHEYFRERHHLSRHMTSHN